MSLQAGPNNTLTEIPYVPPIDIPSQTGALSSDDRNKLDGLGVTYQEVPTGAVNGSNMVFTVTNTPTTPIIVTVNGIVQTPTIDYSISGLTITFTYAPSIGDELVVIYGTSIVGAALPDGNKGDITVAGSSWTINANAVTNADLAQAATATLKGRVTAGTGNVTDLTGTEATTLLDTFTSSLKGLAPASGGGTTNYLRADGTWAAPAGGGGGSALTPVAGQTYWEYEEFLGGSTGLKANLAASNSGGTIASLVAVDFSAVHDTAQVMGVTRFSTGAAASASQRAAIISPNTAGVLGMWFNNGYSARLVMKVGNFLNPFDAVTNTGHIILGFANGTTSTTPGNSAAFISINGGNFFATTRNGGTAVTTDTGIAPTAGSAFRIFDISVNATGTEAVYKIDGTTVATHTTAIPVTRLTAMGIVLSILRLSATAYASSFDIDSLAFGVTRTTALFT